MLVAASKTKGSTKRLDLFVLAQRPSSRPNKPKGSVREEVDSFKQGNVVTSPYLIFFDI